jgi:hypothetical protein
MVYNLNKLGKLLLNHLFGSTFWLLLVFLTPFFITKLEHLTSQERTHVANPEKYAKYHFYSTKKSNGATSKDSLLKPRLTNSSSDSKEPLSALQHGFYFADQYFHVPPCNLSTIPKKVYHFVQHTHTDAGWIQTMQYYYRAVVEDIIVGGVEYIQNHPSFASKFSFTNYDFLRMFFQSYPSKEPKKIMEQLMKGKKYEILSSSIAMPDQAITYYEDLINNIEYGREYGLKNFGEMSRYGWAIDNFGQSIFQARLFAELGYETITTVRLPSHIKDRMRYSKNLNFIWNHQYPEYSIFTHVFSNHYNPPDAIAIDFGAYAGEMITSINWSLFARVHHLFTKEMVTNYANFKEVNVLIGMGDDFQYHNFSGTMKSNLKIYYVLKSNDKSLFVNSTFVVSTVDEFYKAVRAENLTYTRVPPRDFFPSNLLHNAETEWWSGFYSVKPLLKYKIRKYGEVVRGISSLISYQILQSGELISNYNWTYNAMEDIRFTQGILQHHDAITGTCTRQVVADYLDMIAKGIDKGNVIVKESLKESIWKQFEGDLSQVVITDGDIRLWNNDEICIGYLPRHQPRSASIVLSKEVASRIRAKSSSLCGKQVCMVNVEVVPGQLTSIISSTTSKKELEALQPKTIQLAEGESYKWTTSQSSKSAPSNKIFTFSIKSSHLMITLPSNQTISISIRLDKEGPLDFAGRQVIDEGMYTMRLFSRDPEIVHVHSAEVRIHSDGSASLSARNDFYDVQIGVFVDPEEAVPCAKVKIVQGPIGTAHMYKFIARYFVDAVKSAFPRFLTDSNGFELVERVYNENLRPEASYYPLAKFIQIRAEDYQFTVSVDRGVGASSPRPGVADVMFNRATGVEDIYGVPERVVEDKTITIEHKLILEKAGGQAHRRLHIAEDGYGLLVTAQGTAQSSCHGKRIAFPSTQGSKSEPASNTERKPEFPEHQYIKTFLDLAPDALKVRLYNLNDDLTITIDNVRDFIRERYNLSRQITIEERSLDYNQPISEILEQPYMWRNVTALKKAYAEETIGEKVVLKPLKMKTYKIIVDKPAK